MTTFEPTAALTTCENALRELMAYAYGTKHGAAWLEVVATAKQRKDWDKRAAKAAERCKRGVAEVDEPGLAYSHFSDLLEIAGAHWDELEPALGARDRMFQLLEVFAELRNDVAHGRTLLVFERELYSGIAGKIRNQVTLYMSSRDESGQYYPRIESVIDSFGHRLVEQRPLNGEMFGGSVTGTILRPGDRVLFTATGTDPHDRPLRWDLTRMSAGTMEDSKVSVDGNPVELEWIVSEGDVGERNGVHIRMYAEKSKYKKFAGFDHRAYFQYIVRPPLDHDPARDVE
ncbi:hypothetical protein [Nocardia pseudovaccinii]|uniref:hypothetical protein n=1 Tax=Nocardia pseudovaccinii TaxID=189540 RepID=UPI0007A37F10|nr:hypothetical protein [Nocardia pseudovaccinii]